MNIDIYDFALEGVKVRVPQQSPGVAIVRFPLSNIAESELPSVEGVFHPYEKVMNFGAFNGDMLPECQLLETFASPITLHVRYKKDLWDSAKKYGGEPVLGYYLLDDPNDPQLVVLSDKEGFKFVHDGEVGLGGRAEVTIDSWGDPEIVWGTKLPNN